MMGEQSEKLMVIKIAAGVCMFKRKTFNDFSFALDFSHQLSVIYGVKLSQKGVERKTDKVHKLMKINRYRQLASLSIAQHFLRLVSSHCS
jgi:hypothetical protein